MKSLSPQSTFFFDILIDLKSHKVTQSVPGNVATTLNSIFADLPVNLAVCYSEIHMLSWLVWIFRIYTCVPNTRSHIFITRADASYKERTRPCIFYVKLGIYLMLYVEMRVSTIRYRLGTCGKRRVDLGTIFIWQCSPCG